MGLPVTVYRSTDPGAPQLTDCKPSEVIAILQACLVDGYGTKDPLGWTKEYEDVGAVAAAFRNSTVDGSGGYVKCYSANGSDSANVNFRLICAREMTDINTAINSSGFQEYELYKPYQPGTWHVIGTSRGAWLIIDTVYPGGHSGYSITNSTAQIHQITTFFGDKDSLDANDVSDFILLKGTASINNSASYQNMIGGSNTLNCYLYSADGSAQTPKNYIGDLPFKYSTSKYSSTADGMGVAHGLTNVMITKGTTDLSPSVTFPYCRGRVPGLYQSSFSGYSSETYPLDLSINGTQYMLLSCWYFNNLWIDLDEWYV